MDELRRYDPSTKIIGEMDADPTGDYVRFDDIRGEEVKQETVEVDAKTLIKLRDYLVTKNTDGAYHLLYTLADPHFANVNPWGKWENLAKPEPKE